MQPSREIMGNSGKLLLHWNESSNEACNEALHLSVMRYLDALHAVLAENIEGFDHLVTEKLLQ